VQLERGIEPGKPPLGAGEAPGQDVEPDAPGIEGEVLAPLAEIDGRRKCWNTSCGAEVDHQERAHQAADRDQIAAREHQHLGDAVGAVPVPGFGRQRVGIEAGEGAADGDEQIAR
jgi:hypothetical protein